MTTSALGTAWAVLGSQLVVTPAYADSLFIRDRNVSIQERARPEFAAEGVRAGQFIVKPKIDLGVGYTTNAYGISNVPESFGIEAFEDESDVFFMARPSVTFDSVWSRHEVSGGAYVETFTNRQFDSEARTNYGAYLNGKIDVSRALAVFGGVSADRQSETRLATTAPIITDNPIEYDLSKVHVGLQHEVNRFLYRVVGRFANYNFYDAGIIPINAPNAQQEADQDFRDRRSYSVLGKVGFAVSRDVSIFFSGSVNEQFYDDEPVVTVADNGAITGRFDRDSTGWDLKVGADFDLTNLIRGSISVGRFEQNYEDIRLRTADGLSIEGGLEWFPRERTTVSFSGRRGVDESAIINTGGAVTTEGLIRVDQEIRHNVIGYVLGGYGTIDYPDIIRIGAGGDDEIQRTRLGAGVTYYHSRNLETTLGYSYQNQNAQEEVFEDENSGADDFDYDVHQLMLTLRLKR